MSLDWRCCVKCRQQHLGGLHRTPEGDHCMSGCANYITFYKSIGGWKAVQVWWNPDMGGFWEPWETGCGAYATWQEAEDEAKCWAEDEQLEYRPGKEEP